MKDINKSKTAELLVIFCAVAITLGGCTIVGDGSRETPGASQDETSKRLTTVDPVQQPGVNEVQIVIENFAFVPSEVTIAAGTKVTWINKDEAPHTATSVDQKFNSGGLDTDDKFSFVFTEKGDYQYFCTLHPHMKAQIKVK